nr:PREDICTED: uncharacterized protein LOC106705163 [Latimeria chalumnae]|eukprot:XP_014349370.1 PREDICTED: uncharacterized protein LOC106705163 [Latimeria chalumnae]
MLDCLGVGVLRDQGVHPVRKDPLGFSESLDNKAHLVKKGRKENQELVCVEQRENLVLTVNPECLALAKMAETEPGASLAYQGARVFLALQGSPATLASVILPPACRECRLSSGRWAGRSHRA